MIEDKSTGDSSAFEAQVCQGLEFSNVRNGCKRSFEIKIITGTKVSNHHGVMIEVNSTGDSSVGEAQGFKVFQFFDVRNSCKRRVEIKIITG